MGTLEVNSYSIPLHFCLQSIFSSTMEGKLMFIIIFATFHIGWTNGCAEMVRVIKEVTIEKGKAGASSSYGNGPWGNPDNAFRQDIKECWESGMYSNGVRMPPPHLIWYDFTNEKAFIPAEVSFRTRQDNNNYRIYGPTKWQFVGTNDEKCDAKAAWAILCEDLSGAPYTKMGQIKFCSVPSHLNKKFRCVGLRILESTNNLEMGVQSLRFWEKVE